MRRVLMGAVMIALVAARAGTPATPDTGGVDALSWLEGMWTGEKDGVSMEELWTAPRGHALLGLHRDVKDGRLVSWEFFRIQATESGAAYFASPRSAPPVAFRLVESTAKRVVFENKEHDFPQRILYWLDTEGALHARIEGPQHGTTVSEEWVWTRRP